MNEVEKACLSDEGLETTPLHVDSSLNLRELHRTTHVRCNYAFCCDTMGSGKSYDMLAHICQQPFLTPLDVKSAHIRHSVFHLRRYEFNQHYVYFKTNLLIIPTSIVVQWKKYLEHFPTLSAVVICSELDIVQLVGTNEMRQTFWNDLKEGKYHLLIISHTFVESFFNWFYNYRTIPLVQKAYNYKRTHRAGEQYDHVPIHHLLAKRMENDDVVESITDVDALGKSVTSRKKSHTDFILLRESATIGEPTDFFLEELTRTIPSFSDLNLSNLDNPMSVIQEHVCFSRVVVDEADTIYFKSHSRLPNALFYWFVTSSYGNLLFPDGLNSSTKRFNGFVHRLSPMYDFMNSIHSMPHIREVFLMNDPDYIQQCIHLPPMNQRTILCKTPKVIKILGDDASMTDVIDRIRADDLEGIKDFFKCELKSIEDVGEAYEKRLSTLLSDKQAELTYKSSISYATPKAKEEAIAKIISDIEHMKERLKSVMEKLNELNESSECPICFNEICNPLVMPCCTNVFCTECVLEGIKYGRVNCAYCSAPIDRSKFTLVKGKPNKKGKEKAVVVEKIRSKMDECLYQLNTLLAHPDRRVLLFSTYDSTFTNMQKALIENKIHFEFIHGSANHITQCIYRFQTGENQLLFLNAKNFAAGLNLSMATDVIIYNSMGDNMKMQVIGRAQRLGRTTPLNVIHLRMEDE
jgi:SNF2 family DNA or RNA helicase